MQKPPSYTLHYWDSRGRAEPIRLLLTHAGANFVDRTFARDEWTTLKPEMPLGQAPVLVEHHESGDVKIPQSMAILRHLARLYDMAGRGETETLAVDVAAETALDLSTAGSSLRHSSKGKDPDARAKYIRETAPPHFARLAKLLGDREWLVGNSVTYADLLAYDALDAHEASWPNCLAEYPQLGRLLTRVRTLPTLKSYWATQRKAS